MLYPYGAKSPQYNPDYPRKSGNIPETSWIVIAKIYPPQDLVLSSMFQSYGIPFKLRRREIAQLPVSIGPLAEIEFLVPAALADEARMLLEKAAEDTEKE